MNLATPLYAIFLANPGLVDPDLRSGIGAVFADGTARLLLIPPFFNKVALLLMLNIADRLPDWATGKRTLAVILGDDPAVRLHLFLMILATLSIMWSLETGPLSFVPFPPVTGAPVFLFTAVLAGIVPGLGISLDASKYLPDPSQHAATTKWKPEVVRSVKQAPYPVLALFFYLLTEQFFARGPLFLLAPDLHVRLLPLYVFAYNILSAPRPPPPPPASATWTPPQEPVLIAGAGPCGLGLYIALRGMGFNARLFERRLQAKDLGTGADVGLWPGAVEILKSYGVGMSDDDLTWWSRETWPVHRVEMVRGDGGKIRDVDMDIVNPPSWGSFRLIGRRPLMSELVELVGEGNIEFGKEVVSYEVDEHGVVVEVAGPNGTEKIRGFMLLGADGIGSNVRKMLRGKAERARYAGEVCHRGVIELDNVPNNSPLREILKSADGTMKLIYGTGWRGSYGVIGQNAGYWWFKHPLASSSADHLSQDLPTAEQTKEWPAPFAGLVKGTGAEGYYVEPVLDRTEAWDWGGEKGRIVCAGDAAHPVTPNMAQGGLIGDGDRVGQSGLYLTRLSFLAHRLHHLSHGLASPPHPPSTLPTTPPNPTLSSGSPISIPLDPRTARRCRRQSFLYPGQSRPMEIRTRRCVPRVCDEEDSDGKGACCESGREDGGVDCRVARVLPRGGCVARGQLSK